MGRPRRLRCGQLVGRLRGSLLSAGAQPPTAVPSVFPGGSSWGAIRSSSGSPTSTRRTRWAMTSKASPVRCGTFTAAGPCGPPRRVSPRSPWPARWRSDPTRCSGSRNGSSAASPSNNSTSCSPDWPRKWKAPMSDRPDIVIVMTDEERAIPPYESDAVLAWRQRTLTGRKWFDDNGISFEHHYTGSLACVPSRPTIFTGQYPDLHGVTQTDGIGKVFDDSRMRWLREGEVPTLGNWFRAAGYDTHYDGKWHISHADLHDDNGGPLATNDDDGVVDPAAVQSLSRRRSACTVWLFGLGRPGTARRGAGQLRHPARPADRRSGGRLAERPLCPSPCRRPRGHAALPAGRQLRQPARHRAVPDLGAPHPAAGALAAGSAAGARRTHRRRGPAHQAGRADRLPRGLLLRLRPRRGDPAHLRRQRPALPRPVLPAARRGGRTHRSGAPRGHRGRLGQRRSGAHRRSR